MSAYPVKPSRMTGKDMVRTRHVATSNGGVRPPRLAQKNRMVNLSDAHVFVGNVWSIGGFKMPVDGDGRSGQKLAGGQQLRGVEVMGVADSWPCFSSGSLRWTCRNGHGKRTTRRLRAAPPGKGNNLRASDQIHSD